MTQLAKALSPQSGPQSGLESGLESGPEPTPERGSEPAAAPRSQIQFSPYRVFSREEWAKLRADTPMTLVPRDLEQLSGLIEELSMAEEIGRAHV